ncbi:hypothetical protein FGG08_007501 [Glutinoglossum americanum]|uniref:Uncharacterized protein n=1 Tax=Glutinoglossum americanum TaxID=1670608 RepID=A0A9P8L0U5_9PEZI|nr:hypothetical protein FGG08_007501 [Glutinoglossum americanum]
MSGRTGSLSSIEGGRGSGPPSAGSHNPLTLSDRSAAPTLSTNPETTTKSSGAGSSGGRTGATTGGGGSTFSSPAPSERSLTTTLTTIQSTAPSAMLTNGANPNPNSIPTLSQTNYTPHHSQNHSNSPSLFSHQFPVTAPHSALPPHLAPLAGGAHPSTYTAATANNLLTDNASILTLASSSKRRRRHSFDTDASVRALAPSSLWGGSRESLPLSVLSGTVGDSTGVGSSTAPGLIHKPSAATGTERASVYSATGIAPTLGSERNSYYGGRPSDGASVKSGYLGHGRNDSVGGSAVPPASPLIGSSAVGIAGGKVSRRSSGWGEVEEGEKELSEVMDGGEKDKGKEENEKVAEVPQ